VCKKKKRVFAKKQTLSFTLTAAYHPHEYKIHASWLARQIITPKGHALLKCAKGFNNPFFPLCHQQLKMVFNLQRMLTFTIPILGNGSS
jgi:hypothetical protein